MTVYWIGCAASALLACLCSNTVRGRNNRAASVFFSALPLIFLSALRYDVGYDYLPTYVGYFNLVKNNMVNDANRLEWLWHLINKALTLMNADPMWLFAIAAVIFFLTVYSEIFRDSHYTPLFRKINGFHANFTVFSFFVYHTGRYCRQEAAAYPEDSYGAHGSDTRSFRLPSAQSTPQGKERKAPSDPLPLRSYL